MANVRTGGRTKKLNATKSTSDARMAANRFPLAAMINTISRQAKAAVVSFMTESYGCGAVSAGLRLRYVSAGTLKKPRSRRDAAMRGTQRDRFAFLGRIR